jgi:hypothetical protein
MNSFRVRWLSRQRFSVPLRFEFTLGSALLVALLMVARPSPAVDHTRPVSVRRPLPRPVLTLPTAPQVAPVLAQGANTAPIPPIIITARPRRLHGLVQAPERNVFGNDLVDLKMEPNRLSPNVLRNAPTWGTPETLSEDHCLISVPDVDPQFVVAPPVIDQHMIVAPRVVGRPFSSQGSAPGR